MRTSQVQAGSGVHRVRCFVAGVALLAIMTSTAWASTLELRADVVTTDATTRTIVADGRVRVTDGASVVLANHALYRLNEGRLVLSGSVTIRTSGGDLRAGQVTVFLGKGSTVDTVEAAGAVRVETQGRVLNADRASYALGTGQLVANGHIKLVMPPDLVVSGGDLIADIRRRVAVLSGRARVENKDGAIEGDRLEVDGSTQTAFVRDRVLAVFHDTQVRADTATFRAAERKAVFRGHVKVTGPRRTMTSDQVTIYYQQGRFVAEGTTAIHIEEERP